MKTMLIADEEVHMRNLLKAIFTQQGYKAQTAINGKEALEKIYDNQFDIAVISHDLSVINGAQLIDWLDTNEIYTPIVVMGSYIKATEQKVKRYSSVKSVLYKPFKVQDLTEAVQSIIN